MFGKKQQIDCKKSLQKFLDIKRDSFSRLRHLRLLLDYIELKESKELFEQQFTHIYHIFFDSFISLESAFKQRNPKTNREELESVLFIFEKILTLLPELLQKKWQIQSFLLVIRKFLHHLNTVKIRQEGMRFFLIWYQIMGEELSSISEVETIYASLVPGLVPSLPNHFLQSQQNPSNASNFVNPSLHDSNGNNLTAGINSTDVMTVTLSASSVQSCPVEPFVPAFHSDPQPQDVTCYYLQCLMDYMITQTSKIYWRDSRESKQLKCFEFLLEQFRKVYLMHIFPNLTNVSLYNPSSELPVLRKCIDDNVYFDVSRFPHRDTLFHCQSVVLRWLSKYLRTETNEPSDRKDSIEEQQHYSKLFHSHHNLMAAQESSYTEWREPTPLEYNIIRITFNSSRTYVNLIHSLFKEAFLLPFSHAMTMRKVITVYRHWIYRTTSIPLFIEEPLTYNNNSLNNGREDVRAGISNLLRVFVSVASNVFLLEVPPDKPLMLEEQVDMCKRVLNIYRYMVMKIEMDKLAWERLLQVLLQITSLVLSENIPIRKDDTLGGRLAPAFFQTLIVTWIKANLNVYVSVSLWEKFQELVSSLTKWEELIKEWSKTMDTLTRVMSRYVYNINLHDLPLDRLSERNKKKFRAMRGISNENKTITQSVITGDNSIHEIETKSVKRIRSSSGDSPSIAEKLISSQNSQQTIVRSHSDSHLLRNKAAKYQKRKQNNINAKNNEESNKSKADNRFDITGKCRSLEYIDNRNDSPLWSESSVSRSPSPTHSNVIESNSLKDSPMNIEAGHQNSGTAAVSAMSVLAGGTYRGWSSESALILWRRMSGILGDINKLSDPLIHAQAMECLVKVVEDLIKVKENLGISLDNQSVPIPSLEPPLQYFSSWLFKATQLPNEYKAGKISAYKLLCIITIRRNEIEPSKEFLSLFYLTLRQGLITYDMEITSTIIKYCGPKFFSIGLPGSLCLLFEFINAANSIVSSQENNLPRVEALHLLGSLIGFSNIFSNILVFQSRSSQPSLMLYKDAKDHVLEIIFNSSKREQTGLGRCIALSSLGIFLYQELQNRTNHSRLKEITNVLIAGTRVSLKIPKLITNPDNSSPSKFNNRVLCRVACDMLCLQCDHSTYLLDSHPEIPKKIIEGLSSTLMSHISIVQQQNMFKEYKNVLLTIMFCLGQWVMSVPKIFLEKTTTSENNSESLMGLVMRCFSSIANINIKTSNTFQSSSTSNEQEIDYTIYVDNSSDSGITPNPSPRKRAPNLNIETRDSIEKSGINIISESKEESDANAIRLAANLMIGHFINYLGHFPQYGVGAARLTCLINENDDNLRISNTDTFDLEVLNAPNVLFFLVNNSSIVSFIELPEDSCVKEVNTALTLCKTPVRTIVRNLLGKFSWDCKQIHSTNKCKLNSNYNKLMSSEFESEKRNQNRYVYTDYEESNRTVTKSDDLESLIQHLRNTSPECISFNDSINSSFNLLPEASDMIALLTNQHFQESRYVEEQSSKKISPKIEVDSQSCCISQMGSNESAFQHCRQLIDQMGFLFWEKRNKIDLLCKNQNTVREIRNLDNQKCRETHKIAVIYVAKGQEDKDSILLNSSGSKAFEEFVSGLGWEVNLETHLGFKGGLQQNKSTGKSAPYFANSFMEVIFHVSTRISNPEDEQMMTKKMRHLGNDEIHIVWSEHSRDYRRGIIPTEFCDALIVIYPLIAYQNLFYIQISRKTEVPFFGPLFNGAVVHKDVLSGLVRATAINASRAKRMHIPYYLNFFEERSRSIEAIVKNCREQTTFEDFSSKIYSPKELDGSRPLSGLSIGVESASISSRINSSINYIDDQQSPQRRSRPLSTTNSEHRISLKNN